MATPWYHWFHSHGDTPKCLVDDGILWKNKWFRGTSILGNLHIYNLWDGMAYNVGPPSDVVAFSLNPMITIVLKYRKPYLLELIVFTNLAIVNGERHIRMGSKPRNNRVVFSRHICFVSITWLINIRCWYTYFISMNLFIYIMCHIVEILYHVRPCSIVILTIPCSIIT